MWLLLAQLSGSRKYQDTKEKEKKIPKKYSQEWTSLSCSDLRGDAFRFSPLRIASAVSLLYVVYAHAVHGEVGSLYKISQKEKNKYCILTHICGI